MSFSPKTSPRGPYKVLEAQISLGPAAEGVTGAGDYAALFGHRWALVRHGNELQLLQIQSGLWVEVTPLVKLPTLPDTARHLAFTFDSTARPVFAYQDDEEISLYKYDVATHAYILAGPYDGVDPVLFNDLTAHYQTSESDVLLMYLSTDHENINYRIQREVYSTEHLYKALSGAVYLDQVVIEPYVTYPVGSLEEDGSEVWIKSKPYPLALAEELLASAAFGNAIYTKVQENFEQTPPQEEIEASASFGDAVYTSIRENFTQTPAEESLDASAAFGDAVYTVVREEFTQTPSQEQLDTSASFGDASYKKYRDILSQGVSGEALAASASFDDAIYQEV